MAQYDLREIPNPKGDGKPQPLYPRIVSSGTISTRKLFEDIASGSTHSMADLQGAITAITERTAVLLSQGYTVELGKMGYFSASLKARLVDDKKEIRSASIEFDNINFRATKWFRKQLKGKVERSRRGFKSSSKLSEERRISLLTAYLEEHPFITRADYTELTGLLKNKALSDLKDLVARGILISRKSGNQLIFMWAK